MAKDTNQNVNVEQLQKQLAEATAKAEQLQTVIDKLASKRGAKGTAQGFGAIALLLQRGTVTKTELSQLNAQYPTDPIFYARKLLQAGDVTVGGVTVAKDSEIFTRVGRNGKETSYYIQQPKSN